jgi:hypothetical protein
VSLRCRPERLGAWASHVYLDGPRPQSAMFLRDATRALAYVVNNYHRVSETNRNSTIGSIRTANSEYGQETIIKQFIRYNFIYWRCFCVTQRDHWHTSMS